MEFFAAFLKDYTESFVGDAYDTGMQAGVELGKDAGYKKAVDEAQNVLADDIAKQFAKFNFGASD